MSKYTQRHYEDMAAILRDSRAATSHSELAQLAGEVVTTYIQARMTALFKEDNPRFQPEKFAMAARPSSGPPPALDFGEPGEGFTPGAPVEYHQHGSWVKGTFAYYVSGTPSVYVRDVQGRRVLRLASQVRRPRS